MINKNRLSFIQDKLPSHTALFITKESDIHYYTGFNFLVSEERESYLVITKKSANLLYSSFNPLTKHNCLEYYPDIYKSKLTSHLKEIIKKDDIKEIKINKSQTYVSESDLLGSLEVKITEMSPTHIPHQKMIKDEQEILHVKKAAKISKRSFQELEKKIKVGITEEKVKELLEKIMKEKGSEKPAFPTIIAFGENSALPHHQPTDKKLKNNMAVLIDFGATYKGYRSDMTRSFWFGDHPTKEYKKVEEIIHGAYKKGLNAARNGINKPVSDIDRATREYIKEAGYGQFFIHTTGHGLGLDIHEFPSINWKEETKLKDNIIFTIEPGIYLKGKFGIRYENTICFNKKETLEITL
ncbi:MAG: aminopeptidase P family protein [Candidatus Pacebacteria bacterium]|nr:aminopeptidase P family protein [Candidatus Paceibacterota bacterium]